MVPELLIPEVQLCFQAVALETLPLPYGIICVLHRQRRQRIRFPIRESLIQSSKFLEQGAHRPAVQNRMIYVQEEIVFLLVYSQ